MISWFKLYTTVQVITKGANNNREDSVEIDREDV